MMSAREVEDPPNSSPPSTGPMMYASVAAASRQAMNLGISSSVAMSAMYAFSTGLAPDWPPRPPGQQAKSAGQVSPPWH
eukprot:1195116-Prorocentrum_minimum.AAC.2